MSIKDVLIGKDPADLEGAIGKVDQETIPAAQAAVEGVVDHAADVDLPKVTAAAEQIESSLTADLNATLDRLERILNRLDGAKITVTIQLAPPAMQTVEKAGQ